MAKAHANSWEVTDEFWKRVEQTCSRGRPPDEAATAGVRGDHVCAAHGLPVEGAAG